MKPPCDEAEILSSSADSPCNQQAGPWILAATILASGMSFIDSTVVNVALPALQSTFNASLVDVQWVVEAYALLLGALILVGGSVGDLYGRRRVFLLGVGLFAISSVGCGLAQDIHQLIVARALQGLGAAFLVPGSLAIISAAFDEKRRGAAIGTWSGFTTITTAIGPVLGGWLIEHASWRWAFFINVPLAIVVIVIGLWRVPESRSRQAKRLDTAGGLLVTVGLAGIVYALIESPQLGWMNLVTTGALIVGAACFVAFVLVERREATPMLPLELFKMRVFAGANLLTLFLYATLGAFFFLYPLNLIQVQGYTATATGAAALPTIVLMFSLSRWSGGLVDRYGPRLPLIIGPIIVALGFLLFAIPSVGGSYWRTFFAPFLVLGFGMAVSVAPLTTVVMNAVDRDHAGVASGVNNAVARIAGLLSVAVLGIVLVYFFSGRLAKELAALDVPQPIQSAIESQSISLAAIQVPAGVDPALVSAIRRSIDLSFVFAFRVVMVLCAGLALLSALQAAVWIAPAPRASGAEFHRRETPSAEPAS